MLGSSAPLRHPRTVRHQGRHGRTAANPWHVPSIASDNPCVFPLAPRHISATIIRTITRLCQARSELSLWGVCREQRSAPAASGGGFAGPSWGIILTVLAVCIYTETLENSAYYGLY